MISNRSGITALHRTQSTDRARKPDAKDTTIAAEKSPPIYSDWPIPWPGQSLGRLCCGTGGPPVFFIPEKGGHGRAAHATSIQRRVPNERGRFLDDVVIGMAFGVDSRQVERAFEQELI